MHVSLCIRRCRKPARCLRENGRAATQYQAGLPARPGHGVCDCGDVVCGGLSLWTPQLSPRSPGVRLRRFHSAGERHRLPAPGPVSRRDPLHGAAGDLGNTHRGELLDADPGCHCVLHPGERAAFHALYLFRAGPAAYRRHTPHGACILPGQAALAFRQRDHLRSG